jgi:hypothetical protein
MRKKSPRGVLALLRGSPYYPSTIRRFARCGLAERPFCAFCYVAGTILFDTVYDLNDQQSHDPEKQEGRC